MNQRPVPRIDIVIKHSAGEPSVISDMSSAELIEN